MLLDRVKLIAEMARQNLTVQELALRAKISRVTLSAVRSGKRCAPETASRIATALGISVTDLAKK